MNPRVSLSLEDCVRLVDITHYMNLNGCLLYLTISRQYITYFVHALSQILQTPCDVHLRAVHHLLQYIKGSIGQGLFFSASISAQLKGFSNADWETCPDTRRSVLHVHRRVLDSVEVKEAEYIFQIACMS